MKAYNVTQGSPEWAAIRAGRATASRFAVLMTAKARKGELTEGSRTYRNKLLAERATGNPIDDASGGFIARGVDMESEARAWYSFTKDVEVQQSGFFALDDGSAGCSLDGLISDDGVLEIKCYELIHHVGALVDGDDEHVAQIQGGLWITGRQWCDRVYYSPLLPPVIRRMERDEEYIEQLAASVAAFNEHLAEAWDKLAALGVKDKRNDYR